MPPDGARIRKPYCFPEITAKPSATGNPQIREKVLSMGGAIWNAV